MGNPTPNPATPPIVPPPNCPALNLKTAEPDPPQNHPAFAGESLLMQMIGALVISLLVAEHNSFTKYFITVGTGRDGAPSLWLVWTAYIGYVLNVFRQVHGLAITATDPWYYHAVAKHCSRRQRVLSLAGLILVIGIPCALIWHVKSTDPVLAGAASGFWKYWYTASIWWPLGAYGLTAFAYVLWDWMTLRAIKKTLASHDDNREAHKYDAQCAKKYNEFVKGWLRILGVTFIGGLLIVGAGLFFTGELNYMTHDGIKKVSIPIGQIATSLWFFIILTLAYTIADYLWNLEFYFRTVGDDDSLKKLAEAEAKKKQERKETNDKINPSVAIQHLGLCVRRLFAQSRICESEGNAPA